MGGGIDWRAGLHSHSGGETHGDGGPKVHGVRSSSSSKRQQRQQQQRFRDGICCYVASRMLTDAPTAR